MADSKDVCDDCGGEVYAGGYCSDCGMYMPNDYDKTDDALDCVDFFDVITGVAQAIREEVCV